MTEVSDKELIAILTAEIVSCHQRIKTLSDQNIQLLRQLGVIDEAVRSLNDPAYQRQARKLKQEQDKLRPITEGCR